MITAYVVVCICATVRDAFVSRNERFIRSLETC